MVMANAGTSSDPQDRFYIKGHWPPKPTPGERRLMEKLTGRGPMETEMNKEANGRAPVERIVRH